MADTTIETYHADLAPEDRETCNVLRAAIDSAFPDAEAKVWHAHPVWLLNSNLITGYAKLKGGIRLLFWSGQAFAAPDLSPDCKFKGAEARYRAVTDIDMVMLDRWLAEARQVQWDYKNIVRNKGRLDWLGQGTPSQK